MRAPFILTLLSEDGYQVFEMAKFSDSPCKVVIDLHPTFRD